MQDQWRHPTKWRVVAGIGTAAALGFAGIAYAESGNVSAEPPPISLQGQVATSVTSPPATTLRVTSTTGQSQSPDPITTAPVTPAAGHDDIDDLSDDGSTDSHDVVGQDSSPDSLDVGLDDSLDSIDDSINDSVD